MKNTEGKNTIVRIKKNKTKTKKLVLLLRCCHPVLCIEYVQDLFTYACPKT